MVEERCVSFGHSFRHRIFLWAFFSCGGRFRAEYPLRAHTLLAELHTICHYFVVYILGFTRTFCFAVCHAEKLNFKSRIKTGLSVECLRTNVFFSLHTHRPSILIWVFKIFRCKLFGAHTHTQMHTKLIITFLFYFVSLAGNENKCIFIFIG